MPGFIIVCVFLIVWGFIVCVYRDLTIHPDCLEAGYPDARVTFLFDSYCIKRVDQTDVVVPHNKITRIGEN